MIKRVIMKRRALLTTLAIGTFFFVGNGGIVLGDSTQEGIDPKGAFLLNPTTTFGHFCAPCHGETGTGDGRYYPSNLSPSPRDFTDAEFMKSRTDKQLFKGISEGSAAVGKSNRCPPWGSIIDKQIINEIIAYQRTLAATAVESSAEKSAVLLPEKRDNDKKSLVSALIGLGLILSFTAFSIVYHRKGILRNRE